MVVNSRNTAKTNLEANVRTRSIMDLVCFLSSKAAGRRAGPGGPSAARSPFAEQLLESEICGLEIGSVVHLGPWLPVIHWGRGKFVIDDDRQRTRHDLRLQRP